MENQTKAGPRDVFGNLLAIVGLYVSVISFGMLVFGIINLYFPDPLSYDVGRYAQSGLRWPLAILVIVFPLYIWLTAYLQKDLEKNPEKRGFRIRKWLLYFTLSLTAVVIAGDLVTLIYYYLNGEITMRFVLKVLTILAIAKAVFLYYGWNVRKDVPATSNPGMKLVVYGSVALGAAAIIAGFVLAGSPTAERARRFDDRRVEHLSSLQYQIVNYWQTKQKLPKELGELRDELSGFIPPVDPETEAPYVYRVNGFRQFELCATFKTATDEAGMGPKSRAMPVPAYDPYGMGETWLHGVGETCFERTIDPDRYPPFKK